MTPVNFAYWLQGFFEIAENSETKDIKLTPKQVEIIRAHLNLDFFHAIDPENLKDKSELDKKKYQNIHDGAKSGDSIGTIGPIQAKDLPEHVPSIKTVQDWPKAYFAEDMTIKFNC